MSACCATHGGQAAAERAHAAFSHYFSPNLAERLASDAEAIALRGQRRDIASLFTDVTGFTTLAETLEPSLLEEPPERLPRGHD